MNDKNLSDLDSVLKQANLVKEIVSTCSMEQKNQASADQKASQHISQNLFHHALLIRYRQL